MGIDINRLIPGCKYFRWKEVIYLPKWHIHAYPTEIQELNLIVVGQAADVIRNAWGSALRVSSGLRPEEYNSLIGGAKHSPHKRGCALDLVPASGDLVGLYEVIKPRLEELGICLEDDINGGRAHIDTDPPRKNTGRFFKP